MNYLANLFNKLNKKFNNELEWKDIAEFEKTQGNNITVGSCRRNAYYLRQFIQAGWKLVPPEGSVNSDTMGIAETVSIEDTPANVEFDGKTGTYTRTKYIAIAPNEVITPELIMQKHNIDINEWDVVTYKNNYWDSQKKGGEIITLFQSKLTVKPKDKAELSLADVDNYFESKLSENAWTSKPAVPKFDYTDSDEYLEIDLADSHIGLLSYVRNSGEDYDVNIASERILQLFEDIQNRCKNKKFKLINLCTLGDILHVDNINNTTTKGTPQDTDGRITKWFGNAVDLIIACIDKLLELECPMKYTYLCGNHDTMSGYMLAKAVSVAYKNNPNIEFDIRPIPMKAIVYGNTLVGLCHGDMSKKNLGAWLAQTYRMEFGQTKFAQVHCGHLHQEAVRAGDNGVLIYHMPSVCASSYWEKWQGYKADRGMMCFIYNEKTGLRDTWYSYL